MLFGCWNIQGISTKVDTLPIELEKYDMDIIALSETKRKGNGMENFGNYILLWSGVKKHQRAQAGISLAIKKILRNKIVSWDFVNERIIMLEMNLYAREVVVIGVYAPTNDCKETIKDKFWNQLNEVIEKIPNRKEIFVMGDINARIGKETQSEVTGSFGEEERNDNGDRLIYMCDQFQLKITNNFFQHRQIHKFTWNQETRQQKSIIDYVLVRQRSTIKVQDVRVYRGAECGSDHYLVRARCFWPWKPMANKGNVRSEDESSNKIMHKQQKDEMFNIELLQDESIRGLYQRRIETEIDESYSGTADEIYEYIKQKVRKVAYETLGTKERNKTKSYWITDEIKAEIKKKKEAFLKWLSSKNEEDKIIYKSLKNKVHHMIRTLKNEFWEKKCADINAQIGFQRSAQAWKTLKEIKKGEKNKTNIQLIKMPEWTAYYKNLLNTTNEKSDEEEHWTYSGSDLTFTEDEIMKELKNIKNNKAPGPGSINGELLKYAGKKMVTLISRLFKHIIKDGKIPDEMSMGYISSIFKKGDRKECSNYRGICVTNSLMKIFGRIIRNRLEKQFKTSEEQCGFTAGKSCIDHIFTIRQILEKNTLKGKESHMVFIDLEKAYDSVPRYLLYQALKKANIEENIINVIKLIYENNKCQIKISSNFSETFQTSKGLLQGCCMSPTLFKIFLDIILKEWIANNKKRGLKISDDKYLLHLLFADDQVIFAENFEHMKHLISGIVQLYEKWGLKINYKKTEYMSSVGTEKLICNGYEIKKVQLFKYLGSIVESNGTSEIEIERRISETKKAIGILNPILWSRDIIGKTKTILFNALIESILLYGAETWTVKADKERKLMATEMDYWRRAARISRIEKRKNIEIREIMKVDRTIIDHIDEKRLTWYGHIKRMDIGRIPKIIMEWEPPGKKMRGRPRKRWQERLRTNMREKNIREDEAFNRELWRKKIKMHFGRRKPQN